MPASANSAVARGMSKPCATSMTRDTPSARSSAADMRAFSCVLRERSSVQRTATPNSSFSACRITAASVASSAPWRPPETSTGKPGGACNPRAIAHAIERQAAQRIAAVLRRAAVAGHRRVSRSPARSWQLSIRAAAIWSTARTSVQRNHRHRQRGSTTRPSDRQRAPGTWPASASGNADERHNERRCRRQYQRLQQGLPVKAGRPSRWTAGGARHRLRRQRAFCISSFRYFDGTA